MFTINSKTKPMKEALVFLQWMLGREAAQMVIDTITLSTSREVRPSESRVMQEVVAAATVNDVRAWFEIQETARVFATVGQRCQSLFLGETTPEAFAAALQDVIDPAAGR
jgi:ABC-type glycerol-3-phosphate transport system substrate-binding protein